MVYLGARDDLVATAAYQPVPAAAAAARRFVRDTLQSWELTGLSEDQDALVDDAVLLTSELVTNAVLHAGTPVQVTCRIVLDERDGAVEIAVLDRRPAQLRPDLPHSPTEAAERTNGRGLQLPSQLASAWGVTYSGTAKAVWFRMSLTGPGRPARPSAAAASAPGPLDTAGTPEASPPGRSPAVVRPRQEPDRSRFDDLLVSTVEAARASIDADTAYVLHAGGAEMRVRAAAAERGPAVAPAGAALPAGEARAGTALPSDEARAVATGALSLVTVPLMVDGRVTGVLAAAAAEPGRFSESDASRLQDLADRSAPALEEARLSAVGLI
jgi:anti-sigma regulatory factor (Ser/Thr protein kinase)